MEIVNNHLSEVEFDTRKFASGMALSKVQLHRYLKALTSLKQHPILLGQYD